MRQHLLDLYEIQKIDVRIRELELQAGDAPKRLKEMERATDGIQSHIDQLRGQSTELEKQIKAIQGNIQAETLKLKKWDKRLVEIRNQREYLALSREIEGSKRANRDAEEQVLELMGQKEQVDTELESLQDKLVENEVDSDEERQSVETSVAELQEKVAAEKGRRDVLLPKIPPRILKRYDMIRAKRLGQGLAIVFNGSCSGCNMRLPPQLYNVLQRGDTIEQCPSCQRLLLWEGLLEVDDPSTAGSEGVEARP